MQEYIDNVSKGHLICVKELHDNCGFLNAKKKPRAMVKRLVVEEGVIPLTPRKAIRLICRECVSGNLDLCVSPYCKLYPYRRQKTEGKPLSPLKAIKSHCLECTGYEYQETKNCTDSRCNLFSYRLGKNPSLKGKGCSREFLLRVGAGTKFQAEETAQEH